MNTYGLPQPLAGVFIKLPTNGSVQPPLAMNVSLPSSSSKQSNAVLDESWSSSDKISNGFLISIVSVSIQPLKSLKANVYVPTSRLGNSKVMFTFPYVNGGLWGDWSDDLKIEFAGLELFRIILVLLTVLKTSSSATTPLWSSHIIVPS